MRPRFTRYTGEPVVKNDVYDRVHQKKKELFNAEVDSLAELYPDWDREEIAKALRKQGGNVEHTKFILG